MKKLVLAVMLCVSTVAAAQESLWATITNKDALTKNPQLSTLNLSIQKAFPSSRNIALQNVYEIAVKDNNCDIVDLYSILHKIDGVSGIEYAPTYETLSLPNDFNSVFANDYALNLIDAIGAWEITTGDSTLIIGISDSNFDFNHQELFNKQLYVSPNINGTNISHGTAVAVTAAGNTNNIVGKSSIGYDTHLHLYGMSYNELLQATYNGCKIINASWSGGCSYNTYGQLVIDEIYNNGSIVVAAAGNGSTCGGPSSLIYPAAFDHVIAVSSVGPYDNHERVMGNPSTTHQHNASVDICAPGYDVALAIQNNTYTTGNGTSFAAPYVSGTIALMLAVNPCLDFEQVEYILKSTAANIDAQNPAYVGQLGAGRLNARLAVTTAARTNTIDATLNLAVDCLTATPLAIVSNISTTQPYIATWSNGVIGDTNSMAYGGLQVVNITDANGCMFIDSILVPKYDPIVINFDVLDVRCNGEMNGKVESIIEGGYAPYTYNWSNGQTATAIAHIFPGSYTLTIEDSLGCFATATAVVNQPQPLVAQIQTINNTIDLQVEGGTPGYTYEWNTGANTEDLNNVGYGFYEVLIMDGNLCMSSANVVYEPSTATSTAGIDEHENIFNVYPNPSNGYVTIKTSSDNCNLTITNANGQKIIAETKFDNEVTILDLATGIYLISVNNTTQKLIVQ